MLRGDGLGTGNRGSDGEQTAVAPRARGSPGGGGSGRRTPGSPAALHSALTEQPFIRPFRHDPYSASI